MEALEIRLAFQDDLLQKLDNALASQQQQLMALEHRIKILTEQLKKVDLWPGEEEHEPPPHY